MLSICVSRGLIAKTTWWSLFVGYLLCFSGPAVLGAERFQDRFDCVRGGLLRTEGGTSCNCEHSPDPWRPPHFETLLGSRVRLFHFVDSLLIVYLLPYVDGLLCCSRSCPRRMHTMHRTVPPLFLTVIQQSNSNWFFKYVGRDGSTATAKTAR